MTSVAPAAAVAVPEERWHAAVALLRDCRDATLVCHVAPDGDALGSMLGLARVLRGRGVDVTCTWGDERWQLPPSYTWLPGADTVTPAAAVAGTSPSLLVVLDTAARDRLGVLGGLADTASEVIVVDHHAHSGGIDGVMLVDAAAAATAVVVEELLRRLGAELDAETATCLYAGLVTDTGGFQHATTPAVHAVAARLVAAGVRPDDVGRRVWGTRPFGYLGVLGAALSRARLERAAAGGRGVVWTWTTREEVVAAGLGLDDLESVVEPVRATADADVAVVLKQDLDGSFRVSTRSRGATDVGAACTAVGGGGHRLAAGFTSYDDVDTTIARLLQALDDAPRP